MLLDVLVIGCQFNLISSMRKKKNFVPPVFSLDRIKLRIDHKTTITVKSKAALNMWLVKYPDAIVVE